MNAPWSTPPSGTANNHPLNTPKKFVSTLSSGVTTAHASTPGTTT